MAHMNIRFRSATIFDLRHACEDINTQLPFPAFPCCWEIRDNYPLLFVLSRSRHTALPIARRKWIRKEKEAGCPSLLARTRPSRLATQAMGQATTGRVPISPQGKKITKPIFPNTSPKSQMAIQAELSLLLIATPSNTNARLTINRQPGLAPQPRKHQHLCTLQVRRQFQRESRYQRL